MATQSPVIAAASQAAVQAVVDTAESTKNNIHPKSVDDAKPALAAAINKAIAAVPEVQFVTNTEPFWKKRSFWGAVGAGLSCAASVLGAVIIYMQAHTNDTGALAVSLFGIATAAWGGYSSWSAGHSTAPLWTTPSPTNPVAYRG